MEADVSDIEYDDVTYYNVNPVYVDSCDIFDDVWHTCVFGYKDVVGCK